MNQKQGSTNVNPEVLLRNGNQFFDKANYEFAICQYIKVIQNNPQEEQENSQLGLNFAELGKDQQASQNFIQQYNITLYDLAQYLKGMAYYLMNQYNDARSDFTQIIQRCPQFKYCYNDRGITHHSLYEIEQAIEDYSEAIKLDKEYAVAYCNRGLAFSDLRRKDEAINDYTQAIKINPQYEQAYLNRGVLLYGLGRNLEAIQDFTQAIEINPEDDIAYIKRGVVLNSLGRKEEAIKDYTSAIEINPQYDQVYVNRGVLLNDLGRKEQAIKDFTQAIEINPEDDIAYLNRGIVLNSLGRKQEAIKDYTQAIQINPQKDEAYYNRGNVFDDLGRKEEAIKEYTKAIEINPMNEMAHQNRGCVLNELGRKKEAFKDYTQAIEINPENDKVYVSRGNILYSLGSKEKAIKDFTQAIEINPENDKAYFNRGNVLDDLRRKDEAYKDYLTAHQIQTQNPLYNIQLGRFLLSKGEKQKAYEFFVQGLKLTSSLSEEDQEKFNLSRGNLKYIQDSAQLVQQIEQEINKVNQLIKSKTLSEKEQDILLEKIKPIEVEFQQQINKPLNKDDKDNNILQQILKELNDLKQNYTELKQNNLELNEKVIQLQIQRHQVIIKEMIELKKDDNQYIYYQSLYWRLYNYISACQQLSTDLFQKNTNSVIDNDKERAAQIISKAGSVPIVGTVITIISSALEFAFQYHLDYKFNQIVIKLTQIVQERCASRTDVDEEIQLAIIKQSKQLGELTNDQQLKEQRLQDHVKQIQEAEKKSGNLQAQNPYWKQGVVDTLRILRNLLINQKQIQLDCKKELNIVILESLHVEEQQVNHNQVVSNRGGWCGRCSNKCSIQ